MRSVQRDACGKTARRQRPGRKTAQALRRELHRAHDRRLGQADTHPRELGVKEPQVKPDVMGDDHPAAQDVQEHRRDLLESRSADDIPGRDAVDICRPDVTAGVDERRELAAW